MELEGLLCFVPASKDLNKLHNYTYSTVWQSIKYLTGIRRSSSLGLEKNILAKNFL